MCVRISHVALEKSLPPALSFPVCEMVMMMIPHVMMGLKILKSYCR